MSAPVNVLAVMAAMDAEMLYMQLNDSGLTEQQITDARAAVAELIEAAKVAEAFISIAVPALAVDRHEAVRDVLPALRAALARVQGGAL